MAIVKWFRDPFATLGDKITVPDAIDPSGYVTYQQGYGPDYERVLATDPLAKAPERQKLNQVLYDITSEINTYYMQGFPDYVDATTNGGTAVSYAFGAIVRWTDGRHYFNTVASNTNDPATSGWILYEGTSTLTRDFSTDADITLTAEELSYGRYIMTDSGTILTATRNVIVSTSQRTIFFHNSTAQSLVIKTSAGTGVTVPAGGSKLVICDGINVVSLNIVFGTDSQALSSTTALQLSGDYIRLVKGDGTNDLVNITTQLIGVGQTWQDLTASRANNVTYQNTTGKPIEVRIAINGLAGSTNYDAILVSPTGLIWTSVGSELNNMVYDEHFIVPNGYYYKTTLSSGSTIQRWTELR